MPSNPIRIPLRARSGSLRAYALVDTEDAHLAEHRWHLNSSGYATRWDGRTHKVYLHRLVLGLVPGDGFEVDHINHDPLDNRRANLRVVTHAQQAQNRNARPGFSSQYRGVHWSKGAQKWVGQVTVGRRCRHVGYFADEHEAGRAVSAWRATHMSHAVEAA